MWVVKERDLEGDSEEVRDAVCHGSQQHKHR